MKIMGKTNKAVIYHSVSQYQIIYAVTTKRCILLLVIIFFVSCGYTAKNARAGQGNVFSSKVDLSIACDEGEICTIVVDNKNIGYGSYHAGEVSSLLEGLDVPGKNMFLVRYHQGDGCPIVYRLINLISKKKYFVSEQFGNCNEVIVTIIKNEKMTFEFQGFPEAQREEISYLYLFDLNIFIKDN